MTDNNPAESGQPPTRQVGNPSATGPPNPPPTPPSPATIGPPVLEIYNPPEGYDQTYFKHFRRNPHELRFLVVHDFRYLQMKNIYYYQMELLHKYPAGMQLDQNNIADLRKLLADYCMDVASLKASYHSSLLRSNPPRL